MNQPTISASLVTLCLSFFLHSPTAVADEQCDHVIANNQQVVDGLTIPIQPGDTLCVLAGERGPLRLRNIIGDPQFPVVIRNSGGVVTTTPYEYSIAIESSKWLRLTSTTESAGYGMRLGGTLSVGLLSEYIEIDHIEVYRARFAGMMIKTEPTCDPATWQQNFTMRGIRVHDNYVHHTETGEGMYIGYTGASRAITCDGVSRTVFPHKITDIRIVNNKLEMLGADGIQLNSIAHDALIANNQVYRTGVSPFAPSYQNSGIQVGGDDVTVIDNLVYASGGNGLMLDGDGLIVSRNKIINAGENGIFARNAAQQNASAPAGNAHRYQANMIVRARNYALKLYATQTTSAHQISDNTIEYSGAVDAAGRPMTFSYLNDAVIRTEQANAIYIVN